MKTEILEFLKSQRVGVFAIEMLDGSPHGATMHFAHIDEPFTIIFKTSRNYRKSEVLLGREISRGTFVVGFEEGSKSKTLQLDGDTQVVNENENNHIDAYHAKFPEKLDKSSNPDNLFFKFTPKYWKFSDWSGPDGKKVYTFHD